FRVRIGSHAFRGGVDHLLEGHDCSHCPAFLTASAGRLRGPLPRTACHARPAGHSRVVHHAAWCSTVGGMHDEPRLIRDLAGLGLTTYEAKAYVALLGRDSFTAAQVA